MIKHIQEMARISAWRDIEQERDRQDEKFGAFAGFDTDPEHRKVTVLAEEFGEVARAVLESDGPNLEEELVQVAAVCVAWLEERRYRALVAHRPGDIDVTDCPNGAPHVVKRDPSVCPDISGKDILRHG